MISLSLEEAQLYRVLVSLFGKEQVLPNIGVKTVCGGEIPKEFPHLCKEFEAWIVRDKCLFTIVDKDDAPKLVVEFFSGFEHAIIAKEAEHQRFLKPLLDHIGVHYVTISPLEFEELLDPSSSLDIVALLGAKMVPGFEGSESIE